ncbi:MAG: NADP oxidoreductase, partial [Acidobacteriota bacterium]
PTWRRASRRRGFFDRLPTPYGLVRFGVAPDHQSIKAVVRVYERIAANQRLRFLGHVEFGKDITLDDLRRHYDQVVYAVGAQTDRRLNIPGEDLEGSHTATEFVAWYNGNPDYHGRAFDLSHERVAVVGIGNVAMDVTRILAKNPDQLAQTDIADQALEVLRKSQVREILVLGRRGPAQAAFSPREIKEIGQLEGVDLVVDPKDMELDESSPLEGDARSSIEYLKKKAREGRGVNPKKVFLRFCVSPVEIQGVNGRVSAVTIEKNVLYRDETGYIRPRGTGQYETVPIGLIFRSVGYRGVALPGLPFDSRRGIIPNLEGRIIDLDGQILPNQYVVGWIKRGPKGLIGTNKSDSAATVARMIEDIQGRRAVVDPDKRPEAVDRLIAQKQLRVVTFEDWKLLDQYELEKGRTRGKVREKVDSIGEMLDLIEEAKIGR